MNSISSWRVRIIIASIIALVLSACQLVLTEDIDLDWTIEDSSSLSLCSAYAIDYWYVGAFGPDTVEIDPPPDCLSDPWDSGVFLYDLAEGPYDITVEARDEFGDPLACKSTFVDLLHGHPEFITLNFFDEDFDGCF